MDWLLTRLNILADGLEKKEQALREIVNITENQNTVLLSELTDVEANAFIVQMNKEKQQFIKQVIQCDNVFESILKEAGPALDAAQDSYKPQVEELQKRIRRVMDLDVKIRVYEEKNNALMKAKQDARIPSSVPDIHAAPHAASLSTQSQSPAPNDAPPNTQSQSPAPGNASPSHIAPQGSIRAKESSRERVPSSPTPA